jgi:hypothetical protein
MGALQTPTTSVCACWPEPCPSRPPPAQVTGTKAELAVRLLDAFQLAAPLPFHGAALLRALAFERSAWQAFSSDGPDGGAALRAAAAEVLHDWQWPRQALYVTVTGHCGTAVPLSLMRAELSARGFESMDTLCTAARAALQEKASRTVQAELAAQATPAARRFVNPAVCRRCSNNKPAAACPNGCCRTCCGSAGYAMACERHSGF